MTVVDAHTHVFAPVSERFPRDAHEDLFPPDAEATGEQLLAEMEQAGVDRAVLVAVSPHDEYLRDCLERFPGRFAAIGVQPPGPVDVEGYRRRREAGIQGVRLFGLGEAGATRADELETYPLLSELARAGDKLWFYGGREQMELLELVLGELPQLTVVLNHLGFWPTAFRADEHGRPRFDTTYASEGLEFVARLARFPGVHVLLTGMYAFAAEACPYPDLRPVTSGLLDAFGAGRALLGSDWPWIRTEPGYAATIAAVDAHLDGLSERDRARVRGENATALLFE
jgi:predicted TIM-barrel fold metal-dependent hydrolase